MLADRVRSDGVAYMTAPPSSTIGLRTAVYIDGFNLYYGAVSQTSYRWLDIQKLAQRLRPHDVIVKVWYFTALIAGPTRGNQERYLKALSGCPLVTPVFGNFKRKSVECHNPNCPSADRQFFKTYEEKRTDVNIAIQMIDDAHRGLCDRMVLISGDSDMVPAIEMVSLNFPKISVDVYIPVPQNNAKGNRERSYKKELRDVATSVRELRLVTTLRRRMPPRRPSLSHQ